MASKSEDVRGMGEGGRERERPRELGNCGVISMYRVGWSDFVFCSFLFSLRRRTMQQMKTRTTSKKRRKRERMILHHTVSLLAGGEVGVSGAGDGVSSGSGGEGCEVVTGVRSMGAERGTSTFTTP